MAGMGRKTLAAFVIGAWLGATVFMWLVATQNFHLVDRLLASPTPAFQAHIAALPAGNARLLMRYQASEVNRLFFDRWGLAQVLLGAIFLWLVFRSSADRQLRAVAVLMLLIALALQLGVVPETIRLGRMLDFAVRNPPPPETAPFWRLHAAYTTLDMLKFLLGIYGMARLVRH